VNICDLVSGLFWLAISIFVCMKSNQINIGSFKAPGPGFIPFWTGVILGSFAVILVLKSILKGEKGGKIINLWLGMRWSNVLIVVASLFIYAIFLTSIGYLIMTFGLMVLLLTSIVKTRLWAQVVNALFIVFFTYIVFHLWLNVQLPKGIFGF